MTGRTLLALGAVLVVPQIAMTVPSLFALGVTLMIFGGLILTDRET